MLRRVIVVATSLIATGSTVGGARAEAPADISIDGNTLTAELQVAGGYSAQLTVSFENVVGLSAENLNVNALAVDPFDPGLLERFGPAESSLPTAFPMLIQIEPDPERGLSFSGIVTVEIYTHDLEFVASSPLRLYSAPLGGRFEDITVSHGSGSYRSGGTKGNFSEFLIAVETRTPIVAADAKLDKLRTLLDTNAQAMAGDIYNNLSALLAGAESAFSAGSLVAAVTYVEEFADAVESYGTAIPNVWSASGNLDNVSGRLRAAAGTLRFSLTLAINDL